MVGQLESYKTNIEKMYKKVWKVIDKPKHKKVIYYLLLTASLALLLLTTTYAGLHASDTYSTDSNAVILTQQFGKTLQLPVRLPGPHATLIIIPLIYLQGHLPYHYTSFTLVNVALVLVTIIAWALLLIKLFGRKYEIPILVLLSSLVFTSVAFSLSIGYTTIRNIEYPIALWFVMIIAYLLSKHKYSRKQLILAAIGSVLFSITLAGDSFFDYGLLLPLVLVIGFYWIQSKEFTLNMVKALGLLAAVFVGAALLKLILTKAGIIIFDYSYWGPNTIIPVSSLLPSLGVALQQLLQLHGAFIFSQIVDYHNLATFVNFGLLMAGLVSIITVLVNAARDFRAKKGFSDNFVFVCMAVSFFVVFFVYALSGYAIAKQPNGQIISDGNARYLSLMPFISVIAIVWLLKKYYAKHTALMSILCIVLVAGIVTSYPSVSSAYNSRADQLELAPARNNVNTIVSTLEANNIKQVSADYWYGPIIGFWSDGAIYPAEQIGCIQSSLSSYNGSFTHQKDINAALIIDRGGLNYDFWTCTDPELLQLYGTPNKVVDVPGAAPNTTVEIWMYYNPAS